MEFIIVTDNAVERLGSFACLILDGRKSDSNKHLDAIEHCKREEADGYNLYKGDSILRSSVKKTVFLCKREIGTSQILTNHSFAWSGKMPCTGVYRCVHCGFVKPSTKG